MHGVGPIRAGLVRMVATRHATQVIVSAHRTKIALIFDLFGFH